MPNTVKTHCLICRNLHQETLELRPKTKRYTSYAQHNFLREERVDYAGVEREGSSPGAETRALYVREGKQYKRVGEICDVGHVQLNQEWVDLQGSFPIEGHVVHNGAVVCRHSGQRVNTNGVH